VGAWAMALGAFAGGIALYAFRGARPARP
jgi:hypothetical protein